MTDRGAKGHEVAFLGYGRMAQAISRGLDQGGLVPYRRQAAHDVLTDQLSALSAQRGFKAARGNRELVKLAPVVIVAVKPHQVRTVLEEVRSVLDDRW